jgi:hypothetical protein
MPVASYPYCQSQRDFIERTRDAIINEDDFFSRHDLRMITPNTGKYCSLTKSVYAENFYVRPIAAWVPHLLLPNFVPTCPHCKSNRFVSPSKARWQNSPKVLFGLKGHRYLDTLLYPCQSCKRCFGGYHPDSMREDMARFQGFFNFHFSGRFVVNEELFSFLVSSSDLATPKIYRILEQMAVDTYLNDYMLYLFAVTNKKIRTERRNVSVQDRRQRTLHGMMDEVTARDSLTAMERTVRGLRNELRAKKLSLETGRGRLQDKVCFKSLYTLKKGRNRVDAPLKKIGLKKLGQLMDAGIYSARELMEFPGVPPPWSNNREATRMFQSYRKSASDIFTEREREVKRIERSVAELEEQLSEAEAALIIDRESRRAEGTQQELEEAEAQAPLFSKMADRNGYNAKVLSQERIDCILMTDFLNRKAVSQSKMLGLACEVLKIDFEYKLAKKVHVYSGIGRSFRPYKSMVVAQNEDNQTVYFKVCQGSESIAEILKGLKALRDRNPSSVKVIYVDNCCNVRDQLQKIFPDVPVKLDPFHWFQRWDQVLYDKKSEEAAIFRGLMRRAVMVCDNGEYNRAKMVVKTRLVNAGKLSPNQEPKHRQVMSEARTVIPPSDILEANVMAVLCFCYQHNAAIEIKKLSQDREEGAPIAKPFFKAMSHRTGSDKKAVRDVILAQVKHIKKNCLSDPENVTLHRRNPRTGKINCCRGTPSCENSNLYTDELTGKSLGIGRCDRLLTTFFEVSNDRKKASRNGEVESSSMFTYRTERLAMVNSFLISLGYGEDELPFKVSHPAIPENLSEADIGFDHTVTVEGGSTVQDIVNQEVATVQDNARFTEDSNGDVDEAEAPVATDESEEQQDSNSEEDGLDSNQVEERIAEIVPEICRRESTMDAFKRLTQQQPWIPFNIDGKTLA